MTQFRAHSRYRLLARCRLLAAAFALLVFPATVLAQEAAEYGTMAAAGALGVRGMMGMGQGPMNTAQGALGNAFGAPPNSAPGAAAATGMVIPWTPKAGQPTRLAGAEIVSSGNSIPVEVQKGSLIRLKSPAATVFITNPAIADVQIKSPTLIYVFGKAPGETSLYALAADDTILFNGVIKVTHNLAGLNRAIGRMIPGGRVAAMSIQGAIILTGEVDSPSQAEDARRIALRFAGEGAEIFNRLRIASPSQVNLRVRIAEVSREIIKQIGFRWDALLSGTDYQVGFLAGGSTSSRGNNAIFGSVISGNLNLEGVIDALESEGLISVLAEPNLTALSGETASFLAGGEFPIPVPQGNGSNAITITFKKFGVGLSFTPTILADNRINLKVNPEVSQLTSAGAISIGGFSVPALTTRRAETTVELGSGQSFAIAGLLQNNVVRDLAKFPGLGDIPILGALFRSDNFKRNESELVIIITPYTVRPVASQRMASPLDGLNQSNDVERILKGFSYSPHPNLETPSTRDASGRRLIGPAGYSLN